MSLCTKAPCCRRPAQPLSKAMTTDQTPHQSFDRQPLASENERLILDIVRRHGPIARASITGHTNLTQQSVHRLIEACWSANFCKPARRSRARAASRAPPSS